MLLGHDRCSAAAPVPKGPPNRPLQERVLAGTQSWGTVGIDVKGQGGRCRPAHGRPRDEAGIPQLVSEMKTLGPLVLLEAGRHGTLVAARHTAGGVVNPRQVREGLLGSWPRPTPSPPCWPTLLDPAPRRLRDARSSFTGRQLPRRRTASRRHQRRPSPHGPHHLTGSKRP